MRHADGTYRTFASTNDKVGTVFGTGMFNGHVGTGLWMIDRIEDGQSVAVPVTRRSVRNDNGTFSTAYDRV